MKHVHANISDIRPILLDETIIKHFFFISLLIIGRIRNKLDADDDRDVVNAISWILFSKIYLQEKKACTGEHQFLSRAA